MNVLVTGGSGYLGTHVKRFLGADDMSRRSGLDILNLQDVQIVGDYDLVIHLAAYLDKSDEGSGQSFLTNVEGTINLLREMKEGAVFIFASTKDVYGRFADKYQEVPETCSTQYAGQSPLEWSKLIAERYVEYYAHARKFRSCIFRLSTIYAPATDDNQPGFIGSYADAINLGTKIALPCGGEPVRDILHVDDLSRACRSFAGSIIRHGLYNLGGGSKSAGSLKELVRTMEAVSGLQAVLDLDSQPGMPTPKNYISDLSLVRQELDWEPEMSLEDGLRTLFP